jgi:hypothetical protein
MPTVAGRSVSERQRCVGRPRSLCVTRRRHTRADGSQPRYNADGSLSPSVQDRCSAVKTHLS